MLSNASTFHLPRTAFSRLHAAGAAVLACALTFTGSADAATTGIINFKGNLSHVTCSATPGPGMGSGSDYNVDFGTVPFSDITDGTGSNFGVVRYIHVVVDCTNATGLSTVKASFDPISGSGIDPRDRRLLQLAPSSVARGAGIALIDENNQIINLGSNGVIKAPLVPGPAPTAKADLNMRAAYVLNGDTRVAGANTAQLPFALDFE